MRPGILELGLILIVVLIIFLATRFSRSGKSRSEGSENSTGAGTNKSEEKATRAKHPLLNKAGFALILIGLLVLLLNISVLKWVFWGSIWALVIALAGLAVIIVARR